MVHNSCVALRTLNLVGCVALRVRGNQFMQALTLRCVFCVNRIALHYVVCGNRANEYSSNDSALMSLARNCTT